MRTRNLARDYRAMPDLELARCCAAGDVDAVRHLVTANNQRLFRTAWSILRNRQEAEDVLQSCYAKAFAAIGTFEGRSSLDHMADAHRDQRSARAQAGAGAAAQASRSGGRRHARQLS